MECRVTHDYFAKNSDELDLKVGDLIKDATKVSDGWCEGTLKGKRGLFRDNCVEEMKTHPRRVENGEADGKRARRLIVAYSYSPEEEDELKLEVGEEVEFIAEVEDGWWKGVVNGQVGIFPSNFVEEIEEDSIRRRFSSSSMESPPRYQDVVKSTDEAPPELPPKPERELAKVTHQYDAINDDELNLKPGDIVTIISKTCEDEGWWKGELNGKVGVFPDNFVVQMPAESKPKKGHDGHSHSFKRTAPPAPPPAPPGSSESTPPRPKSDHIDGSKPSKSMPALTKVESLKRTFLKKASYNSFSSEKEASRESLNGDFNDFNSIERGDKLQHLTANRAKAPKRRPPSSIFTKDSEHELINGSATVSQDGLISDSVNDGEDKNANSFHSPVSNMAQSLPMSNKKEAASSGSEASQKPKRVPLPFMSELKQTQDKKKGGSPTGVSNVSDAVKAISPVNPSSSFPSYVPPAVANTNPDSSKRHTIHNAKAPPLPAKPTMIPSGNSFDRASANVGPGNISMLKKVGSHPHSQSHPSPNTSSDAPNSPVSSNQNHTSLVSGDTSKNSSTSGFVTLEVYNELKDQVTFLTSEVAKLKKMIKDIADNPSKTHII